MNRFEVVVIGGGPIGAVAARCAAEAGASTLLIERRGGTRGGSLCTGLVSPRTLPALGITESSVLRRIRGVEAHAPGGYRLNVRAEETKAVVLDRSRLEEELHRRAGDAGVTVRLRCEAVDVRAGEVSARSADGAETIAAGIIVVAIGMSAGLVHRASLPNPPRLFRAAQAILAIEPDDADVVRVYLGRKIAPLFFGWAVPAERGRTRVGLAVSPDTDPNPFLDRLLDQRFPGIAVESRSLGRIPIGPVLPPLGDGLLLVGDAAGHVKPLSGGGLYTGAIGARIAGRIAASAAASGKTHREDLGLYARACDRALGGELRFGLAARDLLESLSDEGIDDAFAALDQSDLLEFLAEAGDIDRLRRLPRELATRRALWKRLLPLLALLDRHLAVRGPENRVAAPPNESL